MDRGFQVREKHIEIEKPVTIEEFKDLLGGAHEAVQENAASYAAIFKKDGVDKRRVAFCKTKAILDLTVKEQTELGYVLEVAFEMHSKQ